MADTLVLCYHAVSERWPADLSVTPDALRAQLTILRDAGYRGVTFTDAVLTPGRGKRVAVTFDDAFASVARFARPLLDELGWPATMYAVTGFAATGGRLRWDGIDHWETTEHAHELEGLGWDALGELADAGWEIGSHTVSHPHLPAVDDDRLTAELGDARAAVETALGRSCPSVAYPYGDVDARVQSAAAAAGYRTAAALPAAWHRPEPLRVPRVGVYHPDDLRRFRVKSARPVRRLRTLLGC